MPTRRQRLERLPVVGRLARWTDPLYLPNHLLEEAIARHAHRAGRDLLDVGCGTQPYRRLFPGARRYVGLDVSATGSVDVIGDALALPFAGESFDTVMCNQVLEHVPEPGLLMAEALRVLRPGGHLLLTTPQTWGLHLEPHDYYRYTPHGLRYQGMKAGFDVIRIEATSGVWATLVARLVDTLVHTYARDWSGWSVRLLSVVLAPFVMAESALDRLCGRRGDALDNVLVAVKPPASSNA